MAHLLLIGVGLIGASFARAARAAGAFDRVTGFDVDPEAIAGALAAGVVDAIAENPTQAAPAADAAFVAVPPSHIAAAVVEVCRASAARRMPVFDAGSVKAPLLAELRERFGTLPAAFVPCHPMAGAESQGHAAADRDLFRGRRVFLTPGHETDPATVERVTQWWRACGGEPQIVDALAHDRAVAATSHLPHLVAFAYMARFGRDSRALLDFAGPGFRDFTRIAGSDPALWRDIAESNRAAVVAELDRLTARLGALRGDLAAGRGDAVEALLAAGRAARDAYVARASEGGRDDA